MRKRERDRARKSMAQAAAKYVCLDRIMILKIKGTLNLCPYKYERERERTRKSMAQAADKSACLDPICFLKMNGA
jgi:hypothetical protein